MVEATRQELETLGFTSMSGPSKQYLGNENNEISIIMERVDDETYFLHAAKNISGRGYDKTDIAKEVFDKIKDMGGLIKFLNNPS